MSWPWTLISQKVFRDALKVESALLEKAKKYREALNKIQLYYQYVNRIQNEQKVNALIRQQAEYEFSKERLLFELERKSRALTQRLTYFGLIFSVIIVLLTLWFYFDKKKSNQLLSDANKHISQLNENLELKIAARTKELVKKIYNLKSMQIPILIKLDNLLRS